MTLQGLRTEEAERREHGKDRGLPRKEWLLDVVLVFATSAQEESEPRVDRRSHSLLHSRKYIYESRRA